MSNEIRRLQGPEDLESWELFPADLQEMVDWADVYKDHEKKDLSRNHLLIYKHVEESESSTIYPVAVRIHGILEQFRIERFGNWSGRPEDARQAVQYITVASGGHEQPWDATITSLNLACQYVSRRLGVPMQEMHKDKDIYLQRRVFNKRDAPNNSKVPVLTPDDDPEGKFQSLQELWDVMQPLRVAELCANGKKVPINSVLLTAGDFVEVGAELDFVLNRNKDAKTTLKCFLACTYIVRLMPAVHVQNAQLNRRGSSSGWNICNYLGLLHFFHNFTMVKTKHDASPTESHPNKKTKINNTENSQVVADANKDVTELNHVVGDNSAETGHPDQRHNIEETGEINKGDDSLPTTAGASAAAPKRGTGASQPTLAVKTVIPHPTKQLMNDVEVEEYDEALKARLKILSEYTNAKANIYALGKLLPTATWGPYKPINDRSKILCDPATGEPLTIWVIGRIAKMWFMKQGKPENQASITVLPLSQTLAKQSGLLLAKFSNPMLTLNQQTIDIIRAMKWQNTKGAEGTSDAILFDAVYDARQEGSLKTYSERPIWNLADLKAGDLILLEMKMTRYSKKGEDNKWHSRAQFEMIAISLLHMAEMPEVDDQGMHHIDGLAI
ncbi:hypothetical protein DEU56DRAFT_750966 [Suillus clintonianus]|uniref:uncharacterized protein n=1 Tax=Suillus clintonianus TaxID=1904413 RepID=UPI001B861224|nr:uncharacterized protein DEU56DRAFT_750966 [Suillus clintonianus]KAG2155402.1 hypothetical protein DEU56DRAFT_750966 [Suillus clintonianus]